MKVARSRAAMAPRLVRSRLRRQPASPVQSARQASPVRLCGLRESEGIRTSDCIAEPSFDLALRHGFEKHLFSTGWRVILMASEWQFFVSGASTEKVKRRSRRTPRSTKERARPALRGREEQESQSRNADVPSRDAVLEPVACSLEECLLLFGPSGTALNRGGGWNLFRFRQDSGGCWDAAQGKHRIGDEYKGRRLDRARILGRQQSRVLGVEEHGDRHDLGA